VSSSRHRDNSHRAHPAAGLAAALRPINIAGSLSKYKWWMLGGIGLLLAAVAGFLLRKSPGMAGAVHESSSGHHGSTSHAPRVLRLLNRCARLRLPRVG